MGQADFQRSFFKRIITHQLSGIILALVLISAAAWWWSEYFLTEYNIIIIIRTLAFVGIVAIGQSMLLILGELDLSLGAIAGLCGVIGGILMVDVGLNPFLSFGLGLLLGAFCGLINGLFVTQIRLNSLVVTLGMSGVYKGINLVITKGKAIVNIPQEIHFLGKENLWGVLPVPFVILFVVLAIIAFIAAFTMFGRYMYAIGNNLEAASILGIRVNRIRTVCFIIAGFLGALAGMLMVARLGSSQPSIGEVWVMPSIAAPVIGGVHTTGGVGSPVGAVIGALVIGVIENIIVLFGVSPYWQNVVSGVIVVAAISLDSLSRRYLKKD
ncbi:MAG: ABC transporter permease [Planctomycetota bacterium]|jgi:ribose transport system permease protein|nr:ABC transporter permease [Planctomycetota bacterium]